MIPNLPESANMTIDGVNREIVSRSDTVANLLYELTGAIERLVELACVNDATLRIPIQEAFNFFKLIERGRDLACEFDDLGTMKNDVTRISDFCSQEYRRSVQKLLKEMGLTCDDEIVAEYSKALVIKLCGQPATMQALLDLGLLPAKGFPKSTTDQK